MLRGDLSVPREAKPATLFPYHVVNDVGESPNHGDAEEGDAQEHNVQQADAQDVGQPDAAAVHDAGVGVHLAVRCSHVHVGSCVKRAPLEIKQSRVSTRITATPNCSGKHRGGGAQRRLAVTQT